jgi:Poly(ADP-ribose) polymerase catalytic domain
LVRFVLNSFPGYLIQVDDSRSTFASKCGAEQAYLFHPHDYGKLNDFAQIASSSEYHRAFAFHGSSMFNWLSILRDGLKVVSDTAYMSAGAQFGPGIYLAKNLHIARRYSFANDEQFSHFSNSPLKNCVAVCEILYKKGEERGQGVYGDGIFVVTDAKRVVVRALLVNTSEEVKAAAAELGALLTALPVYQQMHGLGHPKQMKSDTPRRGGARRARR